MKVLHCSSQAIYGADLTALPSRLAQFLHIPASRYIFSNTRASGRSLLLMAAPRQAVHPQASPVERSQLLPPAIFFLDSAFQIRHAAGVPALPRDPPMRATWAKTKSLALQGPMPQQQRQRLPGL